MKKIVLAVAIATLAGSAYAGALSDPIVEPIVIIEEATAASNQQWLVPVIFLILLAAGIAGGGSEYPFGD